MNEQNAKTFAEEEMGGHKTERRNLFKKEKQKNEKGRMKERDKIQIEPTGRTQKRGFECK